MPPNLKTYNVQVTQLKISKPFLKIFARNVNNKNYASLSKLQEIFESTRVEEVKNGEICVVKLASDEYERCRVLQTNKDQSMSVFFIDCGYVGHVLLSQLRILHQADIRDFPPLCQEFILAGIILRPPTGSLRDQLMSFHDSLINKNFLMAVLDVNSAGKFVDLRVKDASVAFDLVPANVQLVQILKPIALQVQMSQMLERSGSQSYRPETLVESPEIQKTNEVNDSETVKVVHCEDGVMEFFVRMRSKTSQCVDLKTKLKSLVNLNQMKNPIAGDLCIVTYDGRRLRARICAPDQRNRTKVQLLELGRTMEVEPKCIFEIPEELEIIPPFARRFKLADFDKNLIPHLKQSEVNFYFEQLTKNKLLRIKIVADNVTRMIQSCYLYDEGNVSIFDKLRRCKPNGLKYPEQEPILEMCSKVIVTFAESPKSFFVESSATPNQPLYTTLIQDLKSVNPPVLRNPKLADACLIKSNGQWQRGLITRRITDSIYTVQHVDSGFCDDYSEFEIRIISDNLMKLPPYAYKCCLAGFEEKEVRESTEKDFCELVGDMKEFEMTIIKNNDFELIVELVDKVLGIDIRKLLKDANKNRLHDLSDWSEQPTTMSQHFNKRGGMRTDNDTIFSITESPEKSGSSSWNSKNSTVVDWNNNNTVQNQPADIRDFSSPEFFAPKAAGPSQKSKQTSPTSSGVSSSVSATKNEIIREKVRITAVLNGEDFHIQKLSRVPELEKYKKKLQELARSQKQLTDYDAEYCLALSPFQKEWIRAIILDVGKENFIASIKCLDNGETFSLTNQEHLKSINPQILEKNFFSIRCSLPINSKFQEHKVTEQLMKIMNGNLTYELITKLKNVNFIELYHDGMNMTDYFVDLGIAKRLCVFNSGAAFITYVTNIDEFWIQMKTDEEALNEIKLYTDVYTVRPVVEPKIGSLILAYVTREDCWYRAKITSKEANGFGVFLIDLGNSEVTEMIGEITEPSIARIHPLAKPCSLKVPPGFKNDKKYDLSFVKIADKGRVQFEVKLVEPREKSALVEIFDGDESVFDKIYSSCSESSEPSKGTSRGPSSNSSQKFQSLDDSF